MRRYNTDPRQIKAVFDCYCAETKKQIKKGEPAIFYPTTREVFALDSIQAKLFREWKFDIDILGANY